ncbi:hypothetical protein Ccrd_012653 [Cynara cardunculus var. scolymus]|uniref:Uncharacterized protein n=1 Tax=Cynara cardunculus var. scolymus TaxID=59895 RepID=A0A118K5F5_CYNCS|nr:hypothetical protein Ccrd_012653 [Cynara cardunculus var. scolymus]
MERREACKGGKDVSKKSAPTQSASGNTTAPEAHLSRRGHAPSAQPTGPPVKTAKSSSATNVSAYDQQQITELKLTMDSLEKERDFYSNHRHAEEDASIVEEAQAMLLNQEKQGVSLNPVSEDVEENKAKSDTQTRKSIVNLEVDVAANTTLSPRQRISDAYDVHCSGSPLMTY